jgi:hypothetical protein
MVIGENTFKDISLVIISKIRNQLPFLSRQIDEEEMIYQTGETGFILLT